MRSWHDRFGAEIVACYDTMLQFRVARPPQDTDVALTLAIEHLAIFQCTLNYGPVIHLAEYAAALVGRHEWFLHERP